MEMDSAEILVLQASYTNPVHAEAICLVLNHYAEDPMGGGQPLPAHVLEQLPAELARRPHAFSVLAFVGGEPAGLVNCFEGFSTFACRPLVNVHDVSVVKNPVRSPLMVRTRRPASSTTDTVIARFIVAAFSKAARVARSAIPRFISIISDSPVSSGRLPPILSFYAQAADPV